MHSLMSVFFAFIPMSLAASASGQGSVSLWSDSSCQPGATPHFGEQDPVALNYTLAADVCGTPGSTAHSYIVTERPTCANGSTAAFAYYSGPNCQSVGFGSAMNAILTKTTFDGLCLALVAFNSVAFLCDGIGSGSAGVTSSSSSSKVSLASTTHVASATPVAPSATVTAPLYTTTPVISGHTSSFPQVVAAGGTGGAPAPSGTLGSSPAAFTGAVGKLEASMMAMVAAAGMAVIL